MKPSTESDAELLDWLQEQGVDAIYLADGRCIDVQGNSVRRAIQISRRQARREAERKPQ